MRKINNMLAALALLILTPLGLMAADPVVLPDTGVDVAGYLTATGTALGAIIVVGVGLYFGFLLVRKGIRWASKFF